MKRALLLTLIVFAALSCAPKDETVTVLIVRHAEKALSGGNDPHLSDVGLARSQALARVAENAHVDVVYVTQFQRTRETAAPFLTKHPGTPVVALPVNLSKPGEYPKTLAQSIVSREGGKVVLVVSHSNVVPGLVEQLTHIKVPPIADDDYSRLYIVTAKPGVPPKLIAAQYGCP